MQATTCTAHAAEILGETEANLVITSVYMSPCLYHQIFCGTN